MNLSVIIPIYASCDWNSHVGIRVAEVVFDWVPYGCEIVVVDASPEPVNQAQRLRQVDGVRYFHAPQTGVFSAGVARDIGAQHASRDFVFFFDVDLVFHQELVTKIQSALTNLAASPLSFLMIPCLYLKKNATRTVEHDRRAIQNYWRAYLQGDFSGVINLAVASSAIIIYRSTYLSTGGHRHEFAGHGCEDLELINRLTLEHALGQRELDYDLDVRQDVIANSRGFRRYFAYYGLPRAMEGMLVAHRWHPRPIRARYFRSRSRNDALFKDFVEKSDRTGLSPPALPDLNICGRTLIQVGDDVDNVQAFRQFLPGCGMYQVLSSGDASQSIDTGDRVLFIGQAARHLAQAHRAEGASARGALYPNDDNPNVWRLCWWAADGALIRDEIHEGIRRYYGDGVSYRWIFFKGYDQLSKKLLYSFEATPYDNLNPLPPLEDFVGRLLIDAGFPPDTYSGLFMNQWGQLNIVDRWHRQLRKLILKPNTFFRDSRLFQWFCRREAGRQKR